MSAAEWTSERIKVLMGLWEEGLPTSEIGRRLGVTKNSVVGKVHRLGLKKRQSPIRHASNGIAGVKKVKVKTKTKVETTPTPSRSPVVSSGTVRVNVGRSSGVLVQMEELTSSMCCWPEGEPGTPEFHFCAKPSLAEKPYCADHCERAYVKVSKNKKSKGFEAA